MVSVPAVGVCEIVFSGGRMKGVKMFEYLGTVLSKHREMEVEIRVRVVKGRSVTEAFAGIVIGKNVHGDKENLE